MKHLMKVSLMALVAMFAFSTAADAQLGGLLKKAKAAVTGNSSKNAYYEQQEKYEKLAKEQEAKNAAEAAAKAESVMMVEVKNWKTGKMETVQNPYQKSNPPYTADMIYKDEKNWQDVDSKKQIIQSILSDDKFENRKRAADDIEKDRKLVAVIFACNDWAVRYYTDGTINKREVELYTVFELSNGLTRAQLCYYSQKYTGGGEYSKALTFRPGGINLVKDWEHKDNADPLADL